MKMAAYRLVGAVALTGCYSSVHEARSQQTPSSLGTSLQTLGNGLLGYSTPLGGDASSSIVKVTSTDTGRSLATSAADVYNLADHGADGTATNDDAALAKAITYATARQGTIIYLPQNINGQPWQFMASSLFTFCFPSNTTFAGAGINATSIAWNDANTGNLPSGQTCAPYAQSHPGTTCGYYLFGSSYNSSISPNVRPVNITLRDFKVTGTWTQSGDFTAAASTAIAVGNVDGLTVRNVESDYSRGFGLGVGYNRGLTLQGIVVAYSSSDGISTEGSSNLLATDLRISHTNDDCLSGHTSLGDPGTVHRDILVSNVQCFDTEAIDFAGIKHGVFANITMESPKDHAISIGTAPVSTTATEGNDGLSAVVLDGITVRNLLDRSGFNSFGGGNTAITIDGLSARQASGTTTGVPGVSNPGILTVVDPYPAWMANSQSASVAIAAGHEIVLNNINIVHDFPASNTSAIPKWSALGGGVITGSTGFFDPSLADNYLRGECLNFGGGYLTDVSVTNFRCIGMGNVITINNNSGNNGTPGAFLDFTFTNVTAYDDLGYGIAEYVNSPAVASIVVKDSSFDLDPYDKAGGQRGGSGNWTSLSGCSFVALCKGGNAGSMLSFNNTFQNAAEDTNVDTTDPTTGWEWHDNYTFGNIAVPYTFSGNRNFGIGFVHPGTKIVNMDAVPGDANYGAITFSKPTFATSVPTTGYWVPGDYVRNAAPTVASPIKGWLRVTTGSGNVLNTDWIADHAS